jgi:hypothetical protein
MNDGGIPSQIASDAASHVFAVCDDGVHPGDGVLESGFEPSVEKDKKRSQGPWDKLLEVIAAIVEETGGGVTV